MAIFGALTYQLLGWPKTPLGALLIVSLSCIIGLITAYKIKIIQLPDSEKIKAPEIVASAVLAGLLALAWFYLLTHISADWVSGPWQLISTRGTLLFFGIWFFAGVLIFAEKISAWLVAAFTFTLLSINSILFPLGYGFDIFVHDATIKEWLAYGSVAPRTILYNGFHGIIAALSQITHASPLSLITWTTPATIALLLALLYTRARRHKLGGILLLTFFALLPSLWTTTTPQAFGHIVLAALILEYWISSLDSETFNFGAVRWLIAVSIATIHPLSGIPALLFAAWATVENRAPERARTILRVLLAICAVLAPAAIIAIGAHGQIDWTLFSASTIKNLIASPPDAFQPFVLTRLAYAWHVGAPLVLFIFALLGLRSNKTARSYFYLGLAFILASILLATVRVTNIIGYEQFEFARRILLVANILFLPAAILAIKNCATRAKIITAIALIILASAGWYTAFAPWNSVQRTKAINVSPADAKIIFSIDSSAGEYPYIVLADQVTSAAALHAFGFSGRTLPDRDYFFYPIPTGGILYTNYFLPAMYDGITRELLTNAAREASVHDIYIVLKPYWEPTDAQINALKTNTADWWSVGGAYIGHLHVAY